MLSIPLTSTPLIERLSVSSVFSTGRPQTNYTSVSSHTSLSILSDRDALDERNTDYIVAHDQQHDTLLAAVGSWAWVLDTSPARLSGFDADRRFGRSQLMTECLRLVAAFLLLETSSYDATLPLARARLPAETSSSIEAQYVGMGGDYFLKYEDDVSGLNPLGQDCCLCDAMDRVDALFETG
jgi:hypothetical protein